MAAHAKCSECGASLRDKPRGTKTCKNSCRSARARRLKKAKEKGGRPDPEGSREVAEVVRGEVKDVAREVMKEELRPLVRERMTGDVLVGIDTLLHLTPRAIELLEQQMESADPQIAQRAVTLLLKYTLGNPSVAPAPTTAQPGGLTVQFNIPRPGDTTSPTSEPPVDSDAEEQRQCMDCGETKPVGEFVAGSDRCEACFEGIRGMLEGRFPGYGDSSA